MLLVTHALASLAGADILNLEGEDFYLALAFGILPDFDHLVKFLPYFKQRGLKVFKVDREYRWRTPLQEPVSLLWVIPLSIFLGSFVPIIFFTLHIVLDYLITSEKRPIYPFGSLVFKEKDDSKLNLIKEVSVIVLCLIIFLR